QPVADITQRVRVTRQIDTVAQRRGGLGAGRDDGKVEDREGNHGINLVRQIGPTKGLGAQIRRASVSGDDKYLPNGEWDTKMCYAAYYVPPTLEQWACLAKMGNFLHIWPKDDLLCCPSH